MKHSQRTVLLLLILAMLLACVTGLAQETAQGDGALVIGTTSPLTGEFYMDIWGNNTSDLDIRNLIHGYRTIAGHDRAKRHSNPLSIAHMGVAMQDGDKVFTFTLQPNLVYSDGTAISAKDYVLTLMLAFHPLMREVGAAVEPLTQIPGGTDYQTKGKALRGVRLIDHKTFSITIAGHALPDYNELRYVDLAPSPLHVLLPGVDILDHGQGVQFSRELTAEDIQAAMTGKGSYRSHPAVCSGPYVLASYDEAQHMANLVRNEQYAGPKPAIERIRIVPVANHEIADALKSGRVHLINKISYAQALDDLSQAPGLNRQSYPRQGLAYLAFAFERDAVRDLRVRQAIAHSIHREKLIADFLGGNGQAVNGYYGMGQWMTKTYAAEGRDEIPGYDFDLEKAGSLLKLAGYSEKKPLQLTLLLPEGNIAAEALAEQLAVALKQSGAKLVIDRKPWQDVLHQYYHQTDRGYDMVFMASNFHAYFDPSQQIAKELQDVMNSEGMTYDRLFAAAQAMRATQTNEPEQYYRRWVAFQKAFMEALPLIPLYSNSYTDVFTDKLTDYDITTHMSWTDAIIYARFEP